MFFVITSASNSSVIIKSNSTSNLEIIAEPATIQLDSSVSLFASDSCMPESALRFAAEALKW
jgi:hypothetical protein